MYKPIPKEIIQQILARTDLVELAGEYVQLKKSGKNYMGLCPFHSEKTPSFSVSPEKQVYHCFGCKAGGNAITFIMEIEGYRFEEAVQFLGQRAGIPVQRVAGASRDQHRMGQEKKWMYKAHQLLAQLYHHFLLKSREGQQALQYLLDRGYTQATISAFQLGYAPDSWDYVARFLAKRNFPLPLMERAGLLIKSEGGDRYLDRFRNRVIFPIWDNQGQVIGFGGRLIGEGHPKYLNSPETAIFKKSRQLFNFHRARRYMRQEQTALLFEGYADVLSAYQSGILYGTATLGTALSADQARLLRRNVERVIICYDGDDAGMNAAASAAEVLQQHGCLVKIAVPPNQMDPDQYIQTYGAEAFQNQVLGEARSFTAFQLERLRRGRRLSDPEERLAYVQEALRVLSRLKSSVEREHYLRQLSEEFSISLEALKQEQYRIYKEMGSRQKQPNQPQPELSAKASPLTVSAGKSQLSPAYITAERRLLAYMLTSREVAKEVEQRVGNRFNLDEHQRLAAYIYAFYATDQEADLPKFFATLDDRQLIRLAGDLAAMTLNPQPAAQELEDYMQQVLSYPYLQRLAEKKEEKKRAERQGDVIKAARIAMEIIDMNQKLNNLFRTTREMDNPWKEGE